MTVNVTDPIITSVSTISVTTRKKVPPVLPATVPVGYSDGSVKNLNVTWDKIDKNQYAKDGNFSVFGVIEGTAIKAVANVTVTNKKPDNKGITSINPVNVMTSAGILPKLPSMVIVNYGDGTSRYVRVKWDRLDRCAYSKPGSIVAYGKVEGTEIKAVANITVTDPIIAYVRPVFIKTTKGIAPQLPSEVKAVYSDGSTKSVKVVWDTVAPSKLTKPGIIKVNGIIEGTKVKAVALIIVENDKENGKENGKENCKENDD